MCPNLMWCEWHQQLIPFTSFCVPVRTLGLQLHVVSCSLVIFRHVIKMRSVCKESSLPVWLHVYLVTILPQDKCKFINFLTMPRHYLYCNCLDDRSFRKSPHIKDLSNHTSSKKLSSILTRFSTTCMKSCATETIVWGLRNVKVTKTGWIVQ